MKKLISLEQYVSQRQFPQTNLEAESESLLIDNFYIDVIDFTNKLKQQPQLKHFIPCVEKDGKWVVLDKPKEKDFYVYLGDVKGKKSYNTNKHLFNQAMIEFESASKNVLFYDWEIEAIGKKHVMLKHKKGMLLEFDLLTGKINEVDCNYSDLTKYNLPLTDNGEIYFNLKS